MDDRKSIYLVGPVMECISLPILSIQLYSSDSKLVGIDDLFIRSSIDKDRLLSKCIANGAASNIALDATIISDFQAICFRHIMRFIKLIGISASPEKWI